jgi:hypothetical protein
MQPTMAAWKTIIATSPGASRYPESRDQEDRSSKLARVNSFQDSILKKKPITKKRGWWSGSGVGLEFKPQYRKHTQKIIAILLFKVRGH